MPPGSQFMEFLCAGFRRIPVACKYFVSFVFVLHSQYECNLFCFPGFKRECGGERSAPVFIVAQLIPEISVHDTCRIFIAVIASDKFLPVSAVGCYFCSCQSKEAVKHKLVVNLLSILQAVKIAVYRLTNAVLVKGSSCDKQRILKIYLILFIVVVICKLCISCDIQTFRRARAVRHFQIPHLIGLVKRHIVQRF